MEGKSSWEAEASKSENEIEPNLLSFEEPKHRDDGRLEESRNQGTVTKQRQGQGHKTEEG